MKIVRVLNLEEAEEDSRRIRAELEKSFEIRWRRAANLEEFRSCLRSDEWDLIVSSYRIPETNGIEAFEISGDEGVDVPFIIVSGSISQESAVAAMRLGVSDYLKKDDLSRLVPAVTRALLEAADRREMRAAEKALAESEDRLRLALRAAGIGAWEWDLSSNDAVWSPETSAIIGVTIAGSKGSALREIINANDLEVLQIAARSAIVSRRSFDVKVRVRRRGGGDRWVAVTGKCEFGRGDVPERLVGTIRDITKDKQSQDALAEAEARYKMVSSMATDYMFAAQVAVDGSLSMDWIAGAVETITGRSEDFFTTGGTWRSIVHPDDFYVEEADERAVTEGRQVDSELRIVKPNGEAVWVRRLARPVWDKDAGRVVAVVGAVKNVTERKTAEIAVREREEYLRTVLNAEPQCVKAFAPDGTLLDINPAGLAMLEADSESQVLGQYLFKLVKREYAGQVEDAVRRAFAGETVTVSYVMTSYKGTERRMEMCATPIRNTEGTITAVLGVSIDITEKHRMEAALVESEKQFSDLINTVEGIVWEVEIPTMRFTFVSRRAETILGFPVQRWYEDGFWMNSIHPEDRDFALNFCASETAKGEGHTFEYRMVAADGRIVWLRDIVTVVSEDGKPVKLRGIMVDVTEQRRVDAAMKQQALLIEQSNEAIFVWDLNDGVIEWNRGCEKLYGYRRDEVLGKLPYDVLRTAFPSSVVEFRDELSSRGVWEGEVTQMTAAGEQVTVSIRSQLIELNERKVVLQSSRDLTEMRRAEAALLASEEQLRQAQKLESIGILAGGLAHDFNNMLTAINGYSELILRRLEKTDPIRTHVEEIKKAGERSAELTRQLLAFSRRQILQPTTLNLNDVVADTASMLERLIGTNISISTALAQDLCEIQADLGQLTQVIVNLIINARDAMPEGGSVVIETAVVELDADYAGKHINVEPGRYAMLAVSDNGIGMDEQTRSRVFEPFFTTKPPGRGTGLGLATVYGIVKQSGGNIWVYSEPGKGSTFKVYLPFAKASAEASAAATDQREAGSGSETILLVEDERSVRALAKQILETCGYKVLEAADGAEALSRFGDESAGIDLLVTDIVMPGMGGGELSELMRELCPKIKVLFTSGYTDDAVVRHGIVDEGQNFLQKPFTFDGLARKVRAVLDGGSAALSASAEGQARPYSPSKLLTHFQKESS